MKSFKHIWWPALTTLSLAMAAGGAHAQAAESVDSVRQTTLNLIEALVQNGVLTREKADALIREAQAKAPPQKGEASSTAASEASSTKPVIRVPYIPESVRNQIRDEVKEEVVAQANAERWGVPNAAAAWTNR
ncbi:MAG TPA: putative porin, partial [Aquabacterium sp.]|nr:putative porin [Aquabacterium sp.]